MAKDGVDAKVIRAIVERDCVDFDVDAVNAAELSRALPADVLEAAIACRKTTPSAGSRESKSSESKGGESKSPRVNVAAATGPNSSPIASSGSGELRLRAVFIGESGALSCVCLLDGESLATLTKPAQGEFGEAVARTKIPKESADLPVPPGKHRLVFRCDPKAQEVKIDVDVKEGEKRTVEIAETTFRHWKVRKVE